MNYRHHYHAGCFADVFKHILLTGLLQFLIRKDKPLCYLETHAGKGQYDLSALPAQKTQEFRTGIGKLTSASMPQLVGDYLQIVQTHGSEAGGFIYPGSPCIAKALLRSDDQMILCELHERDYAVLKKMFLGDKQVAVHHMDGYAALKAFLPPKQGRGLVLIDPSFEQKDEFQQIFKHLEITVKRWPGATYAVWYPVKERLKVDQFYADLQNSGIREIIYCEFEIPFLAGNMNACGMVIIRPPWQWYESVKPVLPRLNETLSKPGVGRWRLEWLVGE